MRRCLLAMLASAMSLGFSGPAAAQVTFERLPDLDDAGFARTSNAISAWTGRVVGESASTAVGSNGQESVFWDPGDEDATLIGSLSGGQRSSVAYDVSNAGRQIVGESSSAGSTAGEAFLWNDPGDGGAPTLMGLGFLGGGANQSIAYGVNQSGDTVVGASSSTESGGGFQAFLWTDEDGMVGLGFLSDSARRSEARDVVTLSGGPVVVGFSSTATTGINDFEAFRWRIVDDDPVMEVLPDISDDLRVSSRAFALSEDGFTIVGKCASQQSGQSYEACRWTTTSSDDTPMVDGLGDLPGGVVDSEALAASADGGVIVGRGSTGAGDEAFVYDDENGIRSLMDVVENAGIDLGNFRLRAATDITADGLVVTGIGHEVPNGVDEAWVVTLPQPQSGALTLAALASLAGLRARRRC